MGRSGQKDVIGKIEFLALSWVNFKGAISLGKHKEDPLSEKKGSPALYKGIA